MSNYPKQFYDAKLVTELSDFINDMEQDSIDKRTLLLLLETVRTSRTNKTQNLREIKKVKTYVKEFDFLTPRIPAKSKKSALFLKSVDVLAQQLCLMNQKQYVLLEYYTCIHSSPHEFRICSIEVHELLGQKWSKPNAFELTPQITRNIEYFNRVR